MESKKPNYLKKYDKVITTPVKWLWYPYIPFGKITILQGDPGDGKSSMMMEIISAVTNGHLLSEESDTLKPFNVIYQCSEDGIADTIKPRLIRSGADCAHVYYIDEELVSISLDSDQLRDAIVASDAKLLIIDPIQAYVGSDGSLSVATKTRKLMHRLSLWASMYDCAVILIGHMNKSEGSKDLYRSLGSIDLIAAARSVLQVSRTEDNAEIRRVHQIKSSLAPQGPDLYFTIHPVTGFQWINTANEQGRSDYIEADDNHNPSKQELICSILKRILSDGPVEANKVYEAFINTGISNRTINKTKRHLGILSIRKEGQWYWCLPS